VVEHVEMVELVLLDAPQREQLRQHLGGDPMRVHQLQAGADRGGGDHLLELAEHALGRHALEARRRAADRRRRVRLDREVEVDREADRAQRPQRIVVQRAGGDHAQSPRFQVGAAAVGVEQLAAVQRLRHRVDGEVARGEVCLDVAVAEDDKVDVPGVVAPDDPPGAERAGELECGGARRARERARGILRLGRQGDVEIRGRAAEQAVADGAADDPRLAAREDPADLVERHERVHEDAPRGDAAPGGAAASAGAASPDAAASREAASPDAAASREAASGGAAAPPVSPTYSRGTRRLIPHVIS
jgi:hypothetical protein